MNMSNDYEEMLQFLLISKIDFEAPILRLMALRINYKIKDIACVRNRSVNMLQQVLLKKVLHDIFHQSCF